MKAVWIAMICVPLAATTSFAASVTVPDSSASMPGVAAGTTAILLDAGLHAHSTGGGNFSLEAKKFHCDQYSNGPLDGSNPRAGLPTLKCRINSKNKKDTTLGQRFGDARAMMQMVDKVQNASGGGSIQLTDCASGGYCGAFAKSIKCTINTTIDNFNNGGRWACTFTDGQ